MKLAKLENWDPLTEGNDDLSIILAARKREITNILKSYTGYYDVFCELIQNGLDAVEKRRFTNKNGSYVGKIWIEIDIKSSKISITDNGTGMDLRQFKQFVRPNFSFKDSQNTRGSKGVGATYLAYGFNYLLASTKGDDGEYSNLLRNGRIWVDDISGTIQTPRFVDPEEHPHLPFNSLDRGSSFTIQLIGENIRPKDLSYYGASNAEQWMSVLRTMTPLGGIYICGDAVPEIEVFVKVIDRYGNVTESQDLTPEYILPHRVINKSAELSDYIAYQRVCVDQGRDSSVIPPKFKSLTGIWGEWAGSQILDRDANCPIKHRLTEEEVDLARKLNLKLYIFLAFSTEVWDWYSDNKLGLRKGTRLLRGGLQLATRHMPQGQPITIPMTNNIGFQNLAHVVIHFEHAEPDLGRKGFQPEIQDVAEKLAVSAVTAFRQRSHLLRKPSGKESLDLEIKLESWIESQRDHEKNHPLSITGAGLFQPTEKLPILSEPVVEQDVVSLFNQMLSCGLIRGIHIISSSQYEQYDGLFRVIWEPPFDRYIIGPMNPLGMIESSFVARDGVIKLPPKILEYKYGLDGLIEEFQNETKRPGEIGLAVVWTLGDKWKRLFDIESYLDGINDGARPYHGVTHSFRHSVGGGHAFHAIVLRDLVSFLTDRETETQRQKLLNSVGY